MGLIIWILCTLGLVWFGYWLFKDVDKNIFDMYDMGRPVIYAGCFLTWIIYSTAYFMFR